jgi:predicted dehydrogenase
MVGGGMGAFIGAVHRNAAALDGHFELVAGALSSTPEKAMNSAMEIGLVEARSYGSYQEMFASEAAMPEEERIQCVSVVTPNHTHFDIAMAALDAGFHVICDKPLTHRVDDAITLEEKVRSTGLVFALTHNYTGYPLVKEARAMVREGRLGPIRKIIVEYTQGWLARRLEDDDDIWRTDPARSGICGCMGDIGTHAFNLLEYITGDTVQEVSSDLTTFVGGRQLDDDGNVLFRTSEGAKGVLHASQVCIGEDNNLDIRVYGEKGGVHWHQQLPNQLVYRSLEGWEQVIRSGINKPLGRAALAACRIPGGHPEGFIGAFANIYAEFARAVRLSHGESRRAWYEVSRGTCRQFEWRCQVDTHLKPKGRYQI